MRGMGGGGGGGELAEFLPPPPPPFPNDLRNFVLPPGHITYL